MPSRLRRSRTLRGWRDRRVRRRAEERTPIARRRRRAPEQPRARAEGAAPAHSWAPARVQTGGAGVRAASSLEHVAAAAHREDVPRRARVFFDLFAQPPYVNAHRLLLALEVVAPHLVEERLTGHDASVILHEHAQQAELLGRQRNLLAADGQLLP